MTAKWKLGTRLRKKSGANWQGRVVGFYSTTLTPEGYAIESESEKGSVQIYPDAALEEVQEQPDRCFNCEHDARTTYQGDRLCRQCARETMQRDMEEDDSCDHLMGG